MRLVIQTTALALDLCDPFASEPDSASYSLCLRAFVVK